MSKLVKEKEDLEKLANKLNDKLQQTKAQLDFHTSNGCQIEVPPQFEVRSNLMAFLNY